MAAADGGGGSDDACPVCGQSKYFQARLEFFVSPCGHRVCSNCKRKQFHRSSAVACHDCGRTVKKTDYVLQTFEEVSVEQDLILRRRVTAVFNKTERDFRNKKTGEVDQRAWNDYLEEVEDMIFNLVEGVDVAETEAKLINQREADRESIRKRTARTKKEDERVNQMIAAEEAMMEEVRARFREEDQIERDGAAKDRDRIKADLAEGKISAADIPALLEDARQRREKEREARGGGGLAAQQAVEAATAAGTDTPQDAIQSMLSSGNILGVEAYQPGMGGPGGGAFSQPKPVDATLRQRAISAAASASTMAQEVEVIERSTTITLSATERAAARAGGFTTRIGNRRLDGEMMAGLFFRRR